MAIKQRARMGRLIPFPREHNNLSRNSKPGCTFHLLCRQCLRFHAASKTETVYFFQKIGNPGFCSDSTSTVSLSYKSKRLIDTGDNYFSGQHLTGWLTSNFVFNVRPTQNDDWSFFRIAIIHSYHNNKTIRASDINCYNCKRDLTFFTFPSIDLVTDERE